MPFDPQNAQRLWVLPWHVGWVTTVSFAGSSNRIVAGNKYGQILQWDLPTELPSPEVQKKSTDKEGDAPIVRPSRLLAGHENCLSRIRETGDGRLLTTSWDHTVRVWKIDGATDGETEVALYGEDELKRAKGAGKSDDDLAPANLPVQQDSVVLLTRPEWVRAASFDGAHKHLLVGDDSGGVLLWDMAAGKPAMEAQAGGWIRAAAVSPDARRAVTTEYAIRYSQFPPAIRMWDTATGKEVEGWAKELVDKRKNPLGMNAVNFSPDGALIAFGKGGEDGGGPIYLAETETGKLLWEDKGHEHGATHAAFSADGKHLLTSGRDTTVRVYNVADGKLVATIGKPRGGQFKDWIHDFALSSDASRLVTADMAGMVHVWKV